MLYQPTILVLKGEMLLTVIIPMNWKLRLSLDHFGLLMHSNQQICLLTLWSVFVVWKHFYLYVVKLTNVFVNLSTH